MDDWTIKLLDESHEKGEFCCGKAPLDDFIRTKAGQYSRKGVGRTYVATLNRQQRVAGYYTLAVGAIPFATLPEASGKKLPKHPVPVILLGRLAVDQAARGRRLGEYLLFDAFARCLQIADSAGAYAIEVMAKDAEAKEFYEKYGFVPLLDQDRHLFLPLETIRKGMAKRGG
jgi:ribosomal protein S18 acetylase RimI-like enzyme